MSEPRTIATVHDYDGLIAVLRWRADQLDVSRSSLDEIAGLPAGYAAKALMSLDGLSATGGRLSARNLGRVSMGPMLGALGVALMVVEDPEALARVKGRMEPRNKSQVRVNDANASKPIAKWLWNPRNARRAAKKRWAKMTDAQRKRAARKSWRARRKRARAKSVPGKPAAPQ